MNLGYVEASCLDGAVVVRVYYDSNQPASDTQPLINGPRGYCLDVTNTSGAKVALTLTNGAQAIKANVPIGNPVTSGTARSRTAAQMAQLGFTNRGTVGSLQLED